jgi:hypothetical protein
MPNWNDNIVKIEGDDYEISRLLETAIGNERTDNGCGMPFSMNNFFPTPLKDDGEIIDGWYNWRLNNWGCKWDIDRVHMDRCNNEVELEYQTPWGPNDTFWNKIAEQFPKLKISLSYYEGGMMFGGQMQWVEGELHNAKEHTVGADDVGEVVKFAAAMREIGFEWAYNDIHEYVINDMEEQKEKEE